MDKTVTFLNGSGAIAIVKGKRIVKTVPIDVAVNCCHGVNGEDGCIAALCQMSNIPLVGSGLLSSAVAMDKVATKRMLKSLGFPVVSGKQVTKGEQSLGKTLRGLRYPLIVKPATLGSSIGVEVAKDETQLQLALARAFRYDGTVLCEEALTDFAELNCAAFRRGDKVETSTVDTPITAHEILTFNDKYVDGGSFTRESQPIDEAVKAKVCKLTEQIYTKLNFSGVIRVDYLLDKTSGKLYVNEINTTPGSLAYGLWEYKYSRTQYGEALVEQAVADYREMQQRVFTFESGVLNANGGIKKK